MIRCPYCGSTRIIKDEVRGYLVCANCGAVLGDIYVERENESVLISIQRNRMSQKERNSDRAIDRELKRMLSKDSEFVGTNDRVVRIKAANFLLNMAPKHLLANVLLRRALISYIVFRAQGYPHGVALRKASKENDVSMRSVERAVKKYRPLLWYITLRVLRDVREREKVYMGSGINSQENTRTPVR